LTSKVGLHGKNEVSVDEMLKDLKKNASLNRAGAITFFIGIVRGFTLKGENVKGLSYEAYKERAEEGLQKIREEMVSRDGIVDVHIHHVVDSLDVGDDILYVAVAGRSRKEVFPTLAETVERVKSEVPIYKKEILADGRSRWVSEDF